MNKMRMMTLTLLFVCSFSMLFPSNTFADFDDNWINPYDAIFSWNDVTEGVNGDEKPLFAKYPIVNYTLDFDAASTAVTGGTNITINAILWVILLVMGGACLIVISLSDWAFNQNFFQDNVVQQIDTFVDALTDKLFFGELFAFTVFFLGVSLIFAFGRNEDIAGKLLKVILNLVIAFTLLSNMGLIIKSMYSLGEWGSTAVFTAFGSIPGFKMKSYTGEPGRDAQLNVYDGFFKYNFYKAWQLANFGLYTREDKSSWTAKEKQVDGDSKQVLEAGLVSGGRLWWEIEKAGKNVINAAKSLINGLLPGDPIDEEIGGYGYITTTVAGIPFRCLIVALTFVIGSAYGCLLLAIAGTTIFLQFFLMLLALLAPLVFLLVLLPDYGDQVLLKWVQTVVGAAIYWILASLLFCMVLFLQHIAYEVADNWFIAMFLQLIILFTFMKFRKDAAEFLPALQMAAYTGAESVFFEKSKELVDKGRDQLLESGTTAVLGAASIYAGTNLMGMSKSRTGNVVRGVVDDAINVRKDAKAKGEKAPGLAKSVFSAVRGKIQPDNQQQPTSGQRGSVVDPLQSLQNAAGNQQDGQRNEQTGIAADANAASAALQNLTNVANALSAQLGGNQQMNAESRLEQQNSIREYKDSQGRSVEVKEDGKVYAYENGSKEGKYIGDRQANGEIRHQLLGQTGQINSNGQLTVTDQAARQIGLSGPILAQAQTPVATTVSPQILQNIQQTLSQPPVQVSGTDGQRIMMQPSMNPPGGGTTIINNYNTTNNYTQAPNASGGTHTIERITKERHTETTVQNSGSTSMPQQPIIQPPPSNISNQVPQNIEVKVSLDGSQPQIQVPGKTPSQVHVTNQIQGSTFNQNFHEHLNVQQQTDSGGDSGSSSKQSTPDASAIKGSVTGNYTLDEEAKVVQEAMARQQEKRKSFLDRVLGLFSSKKD